ncbi:hypothetical protein IGJ02_000065 [Enterococcus sp. DIV0724b]|uniref:hypothetical protein n=1 Tax=Enterococcus sp. DIV0724b TaxID=2774694 RepID=UPI003D2FF6AF
MKVLKIFITFWIPTAIVLLLSIFSTGQTVATVPNIIPTVSIIQRNLIVMLMIWSSGFLNKYIPYWIFGFNALFFSVILALNSNAMNIVEVMKYGVIEVLSFSIALSIAGTIKIKYLTCATILVIAAAFLENLVMRGVL